MNSKSCLAFCLPLPACMILLFWFLKGFGCSVSSQLTDRFWQSHMVFLQPSDDVTVWVDGQQGGQMTGWVGGWYFMGHSLPGGWDQKPLLCPEWGDGALWHRAWRWPRLCGNPWGQRARCQPAAHLAAGKATAPWAMWTGTWPGHQGKGLSSTQRVFVLCSVSNSPSTGGTSKTRSEFSEGLLETLISVAKAKNPSKNVCMHFMVWLDEATKSKWTLEGGKRGIFLYSLCPSLFRPDAFMGSTSHEIQSYIIN